MTSSSGKPRIIREIVKDQHTSHWDQDMLSRAELEELMSPAAPAASATTVNETNKSADQDGSIEPKKNP